MSNSLLVGKELVKIFKGARGSGKIRAVNNVDIELGENEIHGIIGESGCGKTTLGRILVGLDEEFEGKAFFHGDEIRRLLKKNRREFYRSVQMIFQNPYDVFDTRHNTLKSLLYVLKLHRIGESKAERIEIISQAMNKMGFTNLSNIFERFPSQLSGGQLQRLAILRSLLLYPKVLVGDEITAMLDVSVRAEIINTLFQIINDYHMSMILISHDIMSMKVIADKISVMYLGEIVETGRAEDIFREPLHPYTMALVSNCRDVNPLSSLSPILLRSDEKIINSEESCFFANRCPYEREGCYKEHPKMKRMGQRRVRCILYD